jgi:hypothetical protein
MLLYYEVNVQKTQITLEVALHIKIDTFIMSYGQTSDKFSRAAEHAQRWLFR